MTNLYTYLVLSGLYPILSSTAALLVVLAMMFAVYAIAVSSERHRWRQTVRYHMPSEHRRQLERLEAERDRLEAALEAERHTVAALHLALGAHHAGLSVAGGTECSRRTGSRADQAGEVKLAHRRVAWAEERCTR